TGLLTLPATPKVLGGAFGNVTLIHWTSDRSLPCGGLSAAGGNVDGAVVCVCNINNNTFGPVFLHDDPVTSPHDRLLMSGNTGVSMTNGAAWFVYTSIVQRWVNFMLTQ